MGIDQHGATITADEAASEAVKIVGARYEVLGLLGSGGMGNVYKARDRELDELVAMKVLLPELAGNAGALERFRREVKLARRVTHPNVARVFDLGEHGSERILTMELVDGDSLGGVLHRERLGLSRIVEIARAICAGVGAAHSAGVLHRDLKPDNVLVGKDGRVLVTDFGIARAVAEGGGTVGFVGTPLYMAPEQVHEKSPLDQRTDIYSFGAMFYEMLVGEPAWHAESVWGLAAARLMNPPPDPRAKRPDLPTGLAELVIHCMAREPADRPASMSEVDRSLAAVALPSTQSLTPIEPPDALTANPKLVTTGNDKRVAVLPFANLGSADQAYVADGLTEDLIDALSIARGLRVRSRGTVMSLKGQTLDARSIGRELDVNVVVEGSVRKSAGGYRVTARLVSVVDGFQLWARRFDVPEAEILAQNDVIAHAIAEALTADLETPMRGPSDARAIDLYLRARQAYHESFSVSSEAPLQLYDQVLLATPDDPRALAGRAMAGAHQAFWNPALRKIAYDSAHRAISLAPTLPDAHVSLGVVKVLDLDLLGAVAPLKRALLLSPSHAEAHECIARLLHDADAKECLPHLEVALAGEPRLEFTYITAAAYWQLEGDYDRVAQILDRARGNGLSTASRLEIRFARWNRDVDKARVLVKSVEGLNPSAKMIMMMLLGPILGDARPMRGPPPLPPGMTAPPFLVRFFLETEVETACIYDDIPGAIAGLRRLDDISTVSVRWLERCPLLDKVRQLPEVAPIRAHFKERARAIVDAYRAHG